MDYGYGRKRGWDDMRGGGGGWGGGGGGWGGGGWGWGGGGGGWGGGSRGGWGGYSSYGGYPTTSRDRLRGSQGRNKMYMQMCNEGTRGEKRRRDADDFDPESKLMRKLFVKNLSPDTKEAVLREYFEKFGTIETCDIARTPTGECKGFGFIVFSQSVSVDVVQGARPHRLEECELLTKRASLVEDKMTDNLSAKKIFIGSPNSFTFKSGTGGLDDSISDEDLTEYFSQFGAITEVLQLYHRDTDRKKGVGFITFEDEDAVDKIVLIGAHIIKGRALEAQKAMTEKSMNDLKAGYEESNKKATDPTDRIMRRLFVRRLPPDISLEDLNAHFGQFGEVVDSDIPIHKRTGLRATYAFLTYASLEQVDECMKSRPHSLNDKEVIVRRAMDNELPEFSDCKKIFLGAPGGKTTDTSGLGHDISDEELQAYFQEYGTVVSVKQIMKETGEHKGVGYVEFEDPDSVDRAVLIGIHQIKDRTFEAKKALTEQQMNMHRAKQREKERGFGSFGDPSYFGWRGLGHSRGGRGRGGYGMRGMGMYGMSDYTTDFNGFGGFGGGQQQGPNLTDFEMTPAEREFMTGVRPGPRPAGGLSATLQGRRVTVEGVRDVPDDMVPRYFSKFGLLTDWTRDDTGDTGTLEFAEAHMVDYCLRRHNHQIDGNEVTVSRAIPKFDEDEDKEEDNVEDVGDNDINKVDGDNQNLVEEDGLEDIDKKNSQDEGSLEPEESGNKE